MLHDIGIKYNTDKINNWHSFNGKSYLHIYENYFSNLKEKKINILEIGVKHGNSLRVWKEYFPNANIVGLDFNEQCLQHQQERIEIFIGSQNDKNIIDKIIEKYQNFDIIIDDGSHINDLIIDSFNLLFPHLTSQGLYIIEDLNCSYENLDYAGDWDGELTKNKQLGTQLNHNRGKLDAFFNDIIYKIDKNIANEKSGLPSVFETIHFYSHISVIKKV